MNSLSLSVNAAQYKFSGERLINIPDISISFTGLLVIKGKIGSGKTILLKTLGGICEPEYGQVSLKDADGKSANGYFVHSQAEFNFVTGIIGDELEFAGIDKTPFSEYLERNVNEMSGGELKRVSVMMAMGANADVILLDEPLDMLDDDQSEKMAEYIYTQSSNRAIIVATHDAHFDKYTDMIVHIDCENTPKYIDTRISNAKISSNISNEIAVKSDDLSVKLFDRIFPAISFKSRYGEITCLYGKNGSGKTLFVRTIAGIGKWTYDGSYEWFVEKQLRGFCLQFPEQMIYQENIAGEIALCAGENKVDEVLDILQWSNRRNQSPFTLSDGEKRTLFIISSLAKNRVCVFDEPFAGLDSETASFIVSQFYKFQLNGASIVYTANRWRDTEYANTVVKVG